MIPYISEVFTCVIVGARMKRVACEKCGTEFSYELTRTAYGRDSAPYFIRMAAARVGARKLAEKRIEERLEHEAELVPCPGCGWVNKGAVKTFRKRIHRNLPWLAAAIVPGGMVGATFLKWGLNTSYGGGSPLSTIAPLVLMGICLLSPLWLPLLRACLRLRINPNKNYPGRPEVPLGTPPAIVRKKAPSGAVAMQAVPNRYEHSDRFAEWAVFRPGQIFFPRVCCSCMAPATTAFKQPLWLGMKKAVALPLCAHCASKVLRTWLLTAVGSVAGALVLAALVTAVIPGINIYARGFIFMLVAALAAVFGVVMLPARLCRPYRLRILSADREILAVKARSRAFTDHLKDQVRQANEAVPGAAWAGEETAVLAQDGAKVYIHL